MTVRFLFGLSGLMASFWMFTPPPMQTASANQKDRWCDTIVTLHCPCSENGTLCCPRGQYGPMLYSCQNQTGSTCADTDVFGNPLTVTCPGFYHSGSCVAPGITCFRSPPTMVACPTTSGSCAP